MNSFFKNSNKWLLSAAMISFAITGLHVVGGTPEIMDPLYASNAPEMSKGIAQVMWNQISLLCIVGGAILLRAAFKPQVAVELSLTIIALYVGITGLFIASGIALFGDIWTMPQWTFFLTVAILTIVGLLGHRKTAAI